MEEKYTVNFMMVAIILMYMIVKDIKSTLKPEEEKYTFPKEKKNMMSISEKNNLNIKKRN